MADTVLIELSREDAEWWIVTNEGLKGPRGRLRAACRAALPHPFTTDSHVHAHDLGRVACAWCGKSYKEHQEVQG